MGKWLRRLWTWLAFWRKPVQKPEVVYTDEYIENYAQLYDEFAKVFRGYIRENPEGSDLEKAMYWKRFEPEEIGRIAGEWWAKKGVTQFGLFGMWRGIPPQDDEG